jgi:hypothetical protein
MLAQQQQQQQQVQLLLRVLATAAALVSAHAGGVLQVACHRPCQPLRESSWRGAGLWAAGRQQAMRHTSSQPLIVVYSTRCTAYAAFNAEAIATHARCGQEGQSLHRYASSSAQ